jgi:hypothetical protein
MKTILLFIAFSFLMMSCETEESAINNFPEDNLTTNTALKSKLLQVLQSPTAIDNIIDGSGCFAILFPYTVVANGQQVNLASEADYAQVRAIFNEDDNDVDTVTIQFPIGVRYADYTETTFATQAQFNEGVNNCVASTELSCMDFIYPVGIKTYDRAYQLAESFDITTKKALFGFLNNLEAYDAVVLTYPLQFNTPEGVPVTIDNNQALEQQIDTYMQGCLNAINPPDTTIEDVIVQDTWYVSYFFNGTDQTADYAGYDFTFSSTGDVFVAATISSPGMWGVSQSSGITEVGFMFIDPGLDNIGQIWTLTSFTESTILLHIDANGVEPERYLTLTKN